MQNMRLFSGDLCLSPKMHKSRLKQRFNVFSRRSNFLKNSTPTSKDCYIKQPFTFKARSYGLCLPRPEKSIVKLIKSMHPTWCAIDKGPKEVLINHILKVKAGINKLVHTVHTQGSLLFPKFEF